MFLKKNKRRITLICIDLITLMMVYGAALVLEFISFGDDRIVLITGNIWRVVCNFLIFRYREKAV